MKITGNEPINPTIWDDRNKPEIIRDNDGLTIRQYFAAIVMQGFVVGADCDAPLSAIAHDSVSMADALILELNKE